MPSRRTVTIPAAAVEAGVAKAEAVVGMAVPTVIAEVPLPADPIRKACGGGDQLSATAVPKPSPDGDAERESPAETTTAPSPSPLSPSAETAGAGAEPEPSAGGAAEERISIGSSSSSITPSPKGKRRTKGRSKGGSGGKTAAPTSRGGNSTATPKGGGKRSSQLTLGSFFGVKANKRKKSPPTTKEGSKKSSPCANREKNACGIGTDASPGSPSRQARTRATETKTDGRFPSKGKDMEKVDETHRPMSPHSSEANRDAATATPLSPKGGKQQRTDDAAPAREECRIPTTPVAATHSGEGEAPEDVDLKSPGLHETAAEKFGILEAAGGGEEDGGGGGGTKPEERVEGSDGGGTSPGRGGGGKSSGVVSPSSSPPSDAPKTCPAKGGAEATTQSPAGESMSKEKGNTESEEVCDGDGANAEATPSGKEPATSSSGTRNTSVTEEGRDENASKVPADTKKAPGRSILAFAVPKAQAAAASRKQRPASALSSATSKSATTAGVANKAVDAKTGKNSTAGAVASSPGATKSNKHAEQKAITLDGGNSSSSNEAAATVTIDLTENAASATGGGSESRDNDVASVRTVQQTQQIQSGGARSSNDATAQPCYWNDEYARMAERYSGRQLELIHRANDETEEDGTVPLPAVSQIAGGDAETGQNVTFPDELAPALATVIQGSRLPLSALAEHARGELQKLLDELPSKSPDGDSQFKLGVTCVMEKIKLLAARKPYFGIHPLPQQLLDEMTRSSLSAHTFSSDDKMEDTSPHHIWRWEVTCLDLLQNDHVPLVKRARTARRKISSHYKAVLKLLQLLHKQPQSNEGGKPKKKAKNSPDEDKDNMEEKEKAHAALEKQIRDAEERVLKFEREEETRRLLLQEKEHRRIQQVKAKEEERALQKRKKDEEKAKKEEEKRFKEHEKALRKERKEEDKRLKEEQRRLAKEEKEREEMEKLQREEEKKKKQRAMMANFFTTDGKKNNGSSSPQKIHTSTKLGTAGADSSNKVQTQSKPFDSSTFREQISSIQGDNTMLIDQYRRKFCKSSLSPSARMSRRKRTKLVNVSVAMTVVSPQSELGGFGSADQCYMERRTISIKNRYKLLRFYEDHRPPYRGTWSKPRSNVISGRRPFGKDSTHLDYEVDSEAEWEAGEEECDEGESVRSGGGDDDEDLLDKEPGVDKFDFADGWLKDDDDESDNGSEADDDEGACSSDKEERRRWKKRMKSAENENGAPWCIVAPTYGGLPLCGESTCSSSSSIRNEQYVLGVDPGQAVDLLSSHRAYVFAPCEGISLDPYPAEMTKPAEPRKEEGQNVSIKKDFSSEEQMSFYRFVHSCNLSSRDKVVEEFRTKHPDIACSRAMVMRKLDSIAVKRRLPKNVIKWEVKSEVLRDVGLDELIVNDAVESDQTTPSDVSAEAGKDGNCPGIVNNERELTAGNAGSSEKTTDTGKKRKHVTNKKRESTTGNPASSEKTNDAGKKRKHITPEVVPNASAALFAAFLKKRKVPTTALPSTAKSPNK